MARFFSYGELERDLVTTPEDITRIAGLMQTLPSFKKGLAVVFGSTAWGCHRWRSDIDILDCFPWHGDGKLDLELDDLLAGMYPQATAELSIASMIRHNLVEVLSTEDPHQQLYASPRISPSTRDHFQFLAQVKAGAYCTALGIIEPMPLRSRIADIHTYTGIIRDKWRYTKDNFVSMGAPRKFGQSGITLRDVLDWGSLRDLAAIENFPKQLMRKILGERMCLPCPDTVPNVVAAFCALASNDVKAKKLTQLFEPFFSIDAAYQKLVAEVWSSGNGVRCTEAEYHRRILQLFDGLPLQRIEEMYGIVYEMYPGYDG